jgi:hypothetical protein
MPEFFEEYTHIVADPKKTWPYFDIPGRLRVLPWSVDECYGRITPQWITKNGLTRHAVVQLALYTCPLFCDVPPAGCPRRSDPEGYITNHSKKKNGDKHQRKYLCSSVSALIGPAGAFEQKVTVLNFPPVEPSLVLRGVCALTSILKRTFSMELSAKCFTHDITWRWMPRTSAYWPVPR